LNNRINNRYIRILIFMMLAVIAVIDLYPLYYMIMSSFKTSAEFTLNASALGKTLYLDNYKALYLRFDVFRLFFNTAICVFSALMVCLLFAIPASFAFAKIRFYKKRFFFMLMIASMAIPGITFIIPNYLFMSRLGLIDEYPSVIIMWAVGSLPGSIFLLTSLMRGMPNEMLEAVKLDGGNYGQTMVNIVIPLSIPGLITIAIFNMTGWWNDLLTPLLYLQSDHMKTMTVAAATILGKFKSDYPLLLTGLVMTAVPPILIYIVLQGYIRKGLVIGAIKE
jgi:raffinose/stachyose/melibiose transport system permease protein